MEGDGKPTGAPNVLLVLFDDVGFGQASTFGVPANTRTLQRLADEGLRSNRFHTRRPRFSVVVRPTTNYLTIANLGAAVGIVSGLSAIYLAIMKVMPVGQASVRSRAEVRMKIFMAAARMQQNHGPHGTDLLGRQLATTGRSRRSRERSSRARAPIAA